MGRKYRTQIIGFLAFAMVFFVGVMPAAAQDTGEQVQNALCFTEKQCEKHISESGKTFNANLFEENPEECGDTSVVPLGYCYTPRISYDLIIDLGQVSQVEGLDGYIRAVYSLAIVFGVLIAVLMTMVAGLQWMTARGNPNVISKAKATMGKSIISVIMLLSVVTIASIVDPKLAAIGPLRTPIVKTVNYIDENTTCEYLENILNFKVKPIGGKNTCGNKGEITALPEQTDEAVGFVGAEVGKECLYTKCGEAGTDDYYKSCIQLQGEYQCMSCGDFGDSGLRATPQVCRDLEYRPRPEQFGMCRFINDTSWTEIAAIGAGTGGGALLGLVGGPIGSIIGGSAGGYLASTYESGDGACVEFKYGPEPVIDCARMRVNAGGIPEASRIDEEYIGDGFDPLTGEPLTSDPDAEELLDELIGGDSIVAGGCALYNDIEITAYGETVTGGDIFSHRGGGDLARDICNMDMCNVGGDLGCRVRVVRRADYTVARCTSR